MTADPAPLTADELRRLAAQHLPASVCQCQPEPCPIEGLVAEIERLRATVTDLATALDAACGALRPHGQSVPAETLEQWATTARAALRSVGG